MSDQNYVYARFSHPELRELFSRLKIEHEPSLPEELYDIEIVDVEVYKTFLEYLFADMLGDKRQSTLDVVRALAAFIVKNDNSEMFVSDIVFSIHGFMDFLEPEVLMGAHEKIKPFVDMLVRSSDGQGF